MRSSCRWPWLTLLACVAASGNAGAQVGAAPDAALVPPAPQPASESEQPAAERRWRLPPMRLGGSLTYDTRYTRSDGEFGSLSHLLSATIGSSTYIYQPWFATASGSLGLTTSVTRSTATTGALFDDSAVHERIRSNENFVTGSARVDLFPRSRFPAEIHYDRQDSRTDTGLNSSFDFRRTNFGVSQRYRPPAGNYSVMGRYDHFVQSGLGFSAKQDALSADFATRWKFNDLSVGASFSRASSEGFDDESRFTSLVARHAYTPSPALSVSSTANVTRTEELGVTSSDLQVLQASSVGYYHQDKSPLTLTGSVRGLMLRETAFGNSVNSLGATVGASYEVNKNLRLNATTGASFNQTGGGNSTSVAASLGANYQGDSIEWRGLRYDWFAGATVGTSFALASDSDTQSEQILNLQLGHSAGRSWRIGPQSTVGINLSQTLSGSKSFTNQDHDEFGTEAPTSSRTLLHSLGVTWQNSGDGRNAFARASFSDSRELGGGNAHFQLFNFQLSGNFELGYGRAINGDLTYQRSMQRSSDFTTGLDTLGQRSRSAGASGEINFRQNQVFGIPRLRFTSRLRLAQDVLKQPGQLISIPDRETRLWENRLDYSIGRIETQLVLRFSQVDGARIDSLWFRIQRNFGQ